MACAQRSVLPDEVIASTGESALGGGGVREW